MAAVGTHHLHRQGGQCVYRRRAAGDTLLKFSGDGQFVKDFGHRGPKVARGQTQKQDNQQTDLLLRGVASATLDEAAGRNLYYGRLSQ
jgi:hypothetical protein